MILNEVLTEELLQQAAVELATALSDRLPPPNEYQHKFSNAFEEKTQFLITDIGITSCTVAIQDSVIHK